MTGGVFGGVFGSGMGVGLSGTAPSAGSLAVVKQDVDALRNTRNLTDKEVAGFMAAEHLPIEQAPQKCIALAVRRQKRRCAKSWTITSLI